MQFEVSLSHILKLIRRNLLWIICSTILGGVLFYTISAYIITPKYTSNIELYVYNTEAEKNAGVNINDINASQKLANTYIIILQNRVVFEALSENLEESIPYEKLDKYISISAVNETEVLRISATTEDPDLSAEICNQFIDVAKEALKRVVKAGAVEEIGLAQPDPVPSFPNKTRYTLIGGVLGFTLSIATILVLFFLDNTVKGEEDIRQRLGLDVPVLGEIPSFHKTIIRSSHHGQTKRKSG